MRDLTKAEERAVQLEVERLVREEEGVFKSTLTDNKRVATDAAKVIAGQAVLDQLTKLAKAKAPFGVKGYVDSPVGRIVLANALNLAVKQYMPTNAKAIAIADAAMSSAFITLGMSFDIPGMLDDLISGLPVVEGGAI